MLKNKHILIGVTGGIAAYKMPLVVREFKKAGADVKVVMSESAKEFVTPLTLSTLSGNEIVVGTFPDQNTNVLSASTWHIKLSQWADVMLIAPATAHTIAKLATGYADNAVTTLALAIRCQLVIVPTMDVDMWHHPATQENVVKLREMGCVIVPPETGELASGLTGEGRLPDVPIIVNTVKGVLRNAHRDLQGKKIVVTAGPTYEPIDPVRFIGNRSSGKMGFAIANAAAQRGSDVILVTGRVSLPTPRHVKRVDIESAAQMHRAVMKYSKNADAIIMAAAVADFTPAKPSHTKIKKERVHSTSFSLELTRTRDILLDLSEKKYHGILIGFALETENGIRNAQQKLGEKKLDFIVLNNPLQNGAGFGSDTNIVTIISKRGKIEKLKKMSKFDIANELLDRVAKNF
ncbi:MAG: bifunctional phosphopantothenoylcysteine decarboxylase/phosphopantothenate--cysteine ligase CoaBC [Ignavibacteriae bacterium]|nr:bifunctional phosphopantothenoylcysteine decarboxylase/phosphopantothenate--cysteine ligase CoaBC [Ignavibacteriota bacterium]